MNHPDIGAVASEQQGFTLIELMIVVVVVAILAAVGLPAYRNHVIKTNRAAAESFMMQIANKQEQYLLDARTYTATLGTGGLNLSTPNNVSTYYALSIGNITQTTYSITAIPNAVQPDALCGTIALDQSGAKGGQCTTSGGNVASPMVCATPATSCW